MKVRPLLLMFVVACAVALPVRAFAQGPRAQAEWSRILARHPELQRRPGLIFNQDYMKAHAGINSFILGHPNIARDVGEDIREGRGTWDRDGVWRDPGWWHANDPDWMYQNHPEWVRGHPEWEDEGDWDDQRHWHNRNWWVDNRQDWVEHHHPGWFNRDNGDWDDQHHWHDRNWWVDNRHDWVEANHPGWAKHHEGPYEAGNPGNPGYRHEGDHHEGKRHEGDHGKGRHDHHDENN